MNPIEFSERLLQTEPGSPEAAGLARDLIEDARYPANFVLQKGVNWPDSASAQKAKLVLSELRELALAPLAASVSSPDMDAELWALRTMAEEMVALRRRAALVLHDHLSNRHRASRPRDGLPVLPHPSGARVCDVAFVLLHQLLHLECSPSRFYGTPPDDRDRQIKKFQESRAFRSALKEPI
jgi:hypothetical protein